ncbi:MAG TPA: RdgB/HAM1 family non-canonical purine NTP pyrophosphatase [Arenimonas sp.]|nr:RdgB/HAM1 family non-canonical purine NTP pyrophosphatase [Arenimonas sp.]
MSQLVIATGNPGKVAELRPLLDAAGLDLQLHTQHELGIDDAEETGSTFIENALLKARHAARASGLPALADDSGLLVDALGGAPGLITAHYAGVHGDAAGNIAKLLRELEGVPDEARGAEFYSVIVLLRHADDPRPLIAEGRWRGRILSATQGEGGFGYDPVFFVPEQGCSAAQLPSALKNRISHRGQALAQLIDKLRTC